MGELALGSSDRQAGDGDRLASQGILSVLDLESRRLGVSRDVRDLIRKMSQATPLWGTPRIHGELLKLGLEISQAMVAKDTVRTRKLPSQTWHTFLKNHVKALVSIDFFVVPTATFRVLYAASS